jgi:hypothetical protein
MFAHVLYSWLDLYDICIWAYVCTCIVFLVHLYDLYLGLCLHLYCIPGSYLYDICIRACVHVYVCGMYINVDSCICMPI